MKSYTDTSSNILQVLCSSHHLLISDLCVSYLLDHCILILKLILWCDSKLSLSRIKNRTYRLNPPAGLCKVVARVLVFNIAPVLINKLIGFNEVPQVIQFLIFIGKCWPKGHKVSLG